MMMPMNFMAWKQTFWWIHYPTKLQRRVGDSRTKVQFDSEELLKISSLIKYVTNATTTK